MVTLDELDEQLKKLNPSGPAYHSVGYNTKIQIGNSKDPFDMFTFVPFGRWDREADTSKSSIAESFKEVIDIGLSGDLGSICLIDIALLNEPQPEFMHEKGMIEYLAEALKRPNVKNVKTVIRLLVGSSNQAQRQGDFLGGKEPLADIYKKIFWPGNKNIITHENATLVIGYYNPTLRLSDKRPAEGSTMDTIERLLLPFAPFAPKDKVSTTSPTQDPVTSTTAPPPQPAESSSQGSFWDTLSTVWKGLETLVSGVSQAAEFMGMLAVRFKKFETFARTQPLPAMSWNHAKYTAVNGKTMMTGGFNFWNDYLRVKETGEHKILYDFGIKLQGDAAGAVHAFAEEMWAYLSTIEKEMDARSMAWKANLRDESPHFVTATAEDMSFPLSQLNKQPSTKDGIKVLTTARVGSMKLDDYRYPSQLLDAFRDILQNASWHYNEASPTEGVKGNAVPATVKQLSDLLDTNAAVTSLVQTSSAAWGSKFARLYAIANAKTSIHMTAESLIEVFEDDSGNWKGVVDEVNSVFKIPKEKAWDGRLWPYDLLCAMAKALSTFATLPAPPSDINKDPPTGAALYLVLSSHDPAYGDHASIVDLTNRLKSVMRYMASRGTELLPVHTDVDKVDAIVDARFLVKRISASNDINIHAKLVCVDRSLLYVGSDNQYPHYNEEFGCWIEEPVYVNSFFKEFYDGIWKKSVRVD